MNDSALSNQSTAEQSADLKSKRTTLSKVLPTDRVSFDAQVELLRAFAAEYTANGGEPVNNEKAGDLLSRKLSGSTVSQTNGFFSDIGLLSRSDKGGFVPSTELIDYNNACQWDESEARLKLRPVFEKAWFYRALVPRLQLSPQPQATCLAILANESRATPEHNDKLANLLNFLALSGVVSTTGGTITLLQHRPVSSPEKTQTPKPEHEIKTRLKPEGAEEHVLYLDKNKERKVSLVAPLAITRAEYDRICKWLEVALIVEGEKTP